MADQNKQPDGTVITPVTPLGVGHTSPVGYMKTVSVAPTVAPTANTGFAGMVFCTADNKLYIYNGTWKSILLA